MFEYLKSLFRKRTPLELATGELVQAERSKLEAETGREYADALVKYNTSRIARLRKYINEETSND